MRITQAEKEQTRERILVETLESLKIWGQKAAPVDKIMQRLGLTSGALYSHFKSKDDLFAQAIMKELDRLKEIHIRQCEKHGKNAVSEFIEFYLSEKHIESIEKGCMFVALGSDIHRLKASVRARIEEKLEDMLTVLADGLPHKSVKERREKVKFIFSSLIGTLILARTMKSGPAKLELLRVTRQNLLKISGME